MPDIALCKNEKCKLKKSCYRFIATPDEYWQTYCDFVSKDCKDYIKTKK